MKKYIVGAIVCLCIIGFATHSLEVVVWPWYASSATIPTHWETSAIVPTSGDLWISPFGTEQKLLQFLGDTSDILYIQTYDFTHKTIRSLLKKLAQWWTDVRIMMENKKYQQYQDTYKQIVDYFAHILGVQVQSDKKLWTSYLHTKLNLTDDGYSIQTANLTKSAFTNREYFFVGYDRAIHDNLLQLFLKDWHAEPITPADIHPNLLVCPINCRQVIEHLLSNAQTSIQMETQYVVDARILAILQAKKNLVIQVVVANVDSNDGFLYTFGPSIARYLPKPYVHAKAILVDDTYLMIGSVNLSANSMDENRELGIMTMDRKAVEIYKKQFARDWEDSKGKWK